MTPLQMAHKVMGEIEFMRSFSARRLKIKEALEEAMVEAAKQAVVEERRRVRAIRSNDRFAKSRGKS